jgi:hypothetical protein
MSEKIDVLNQRLIDYYGTDSDTGRPIFRIVWADDQTEKRRVNVTDSGIRLLFPEVIEMKKYAYLKEMYVLERLSVVPDPNQNELISKLSYEPIWTYRDGDGEALYPIWSATNFIIDALYAALGKKSLRKYVESEKDTTPEGREQRIMELGQELFGNETEVGDALAYGDGVTVPSNYKKESE